MFGVEISSDPRNPTSLKPRSSAIITTTFGFFSSSPFATAISKHRTHTILDVISLVKTGTIETLLIEVKKTAMFKYNLKIVCLIAQTFIGLDVFGSDFRCGKVCFIQSHFKEVFGAISFCCHFLSYLIMKMSLSIFDIEPKTN